MRAAVRFLRTGVLSPPDEIAATDPVWESDVATILELIEFHESSIDDPLAE